MSSQAVAVDMAPDEATGTISVILSCRAPSRQQSITDGQSLIAALEQEERHARGDCTVRQPSRSLTVLCDKDGFQDRYSPCATLYGHHCRGKEMSQTFMGWHRTCAKMV